MQYRLLFTRTSATTYSPPNERETHCERSTIYAIELPATRQGGFYPQWFIYSNTQHTLTIFFFNSIKSMPSTLDRLSLDLFLRHFNPLWIFNVECQSFEVFYLLFFDFKTTLKMYCMYCCSLNKIVEIYRKCDYLLKNFTNFFQR